MKFLLGWMLGVFLLAQSAAFAGKIKVGLVLDKGGKDDKSFNASAFKGASDAEKKLGIELKVIQTSGGATIEPSLYSLAQKNYDLVIGIGFVMGEPVKKVAAKFPKVPFLIVDSVVDLPNVRSAMFKEHEGSFLVGALAAMASKTKTIGYVGGMEIDMIKRFELGYQAGAKHVDPKIKVLSRFIGSTSDAWNNPMKAKEIALAHAQQNADVIFHAAGASGDGVFNALEEKAFLAIGVDSNQNWVKPGRVLTSMIKRVDVAVFNTIEEITKEKFTPGLVYYGLKEDGVGFAIDEFNRKLITPEMEKRANILKKDIIDKKINVPDYYEVKKNSKT